MMVIQIAISEEASAVLLTEKALAPPQTNGDKFIMSYRDRLNCWLIVRLLPNLQRKVVARCRTRSDADGHLQALRRLMPDAEFTVVFDPDLELDN